MNPVYLRLLEIAEDQGETPPIPGTYLQNLLSLSSGRISQISDHLSVAKVGPKGLSNLANLGYNPKWVNEGPPNRKWLSPSSNTQSQSQGAEFGEQLSQPTEDEFALVQQLDLSASCGSGRFTEHVVVKGGLAFKRSSLRDIGVQEEHARVIYATGDSMEPSIGHGRVVLIDTADNKAIDNRVFLICDPDGSILLKRLVREFHPSSGDMRWIMRSDNPNKTQYPDKLLPDDDRTVIVGRAVWTDKML